MIALGLTGEVGAGKSTVARWFYDQGVTALPSADGLVKQFWSEAWLQDLARSRWGERVFRDGRIDYSAVGAIVFNDPQENRWICDAVHPAVRQRIAQSLPQQGLAIAEIPLLFESGGYPWMDGAIFVTAPVELRAQRNAQRGLDAAELARRERFFLGRQERIARSDWVVDNSGDSQALEGALIPILEELRRLDGLAALRWPQEPPQAAELQQRRKLWLDPGAGEFQAVARREDLADLASALPEGFQVEELRGCPLRRRRELLDWFRG